MDPTENKDKFSTGFREVQESFYDLCGKLEKTQECFFHAILQNRRWIWGWFYFLNLLENISKHALHLAEERERLLKIELVQTEAARADTLERYKDIKEHSLNFRGHFPEFIENSEFVDSSKIPFDRKELNWLKILILCERVNMLI